MDTEFKDCILLKRTRCTACGHTITRQELAKKIKLRRAPLAPKEVVFLFRCGACSCVSELSITIPHEQTAALNTVELNKLAKFLISRKFVCESTLEEQLTLEDMECITDEDAGKARDALNSDDWLVTLKGCVNVDKPC